MIKIKNIRFLNYEKIIIAKPAISPRVPTNLLALVH
jgi:hypothetical protein